MKKISVYRDRQIRVLKEGVTLSKYLEKYPNAIAVKTANPSIATLQKWDENGYCRTPCGCKVEPDGTCRHGVPSWLILLGLI